MRAVCWWQRQAGAVSGTGRQRAQAGGPVPAGARGRRVGNSPRRCIPHLQDPAHQRRQLPRRGSQVAPAACARQQGKARAMGVARNCARVRLSRAERPPASQAEDGRAVTALWRGAEVEKQRHGRLRTERLCGALAKAQKRGRWAALGAAAAAQQAAHTTARGKITARRSGHAACRRPLATAGALAARRGGPWARRPQHNRRHASLRAGKSPPDAAGMPCAAGRQRQRGHQQRGEGWLGGGRHRRRSSERASHHQRHRHQPDIGPGGGGIQRTPAARYRSQ